LTAHYPSHWNLELHCRRVSAFALELCRRLALPERDLALVQEAALIHHQPPELLTRDLLAPLLAGFPAAENHLEGIRAVLAKLNSRPAGEAPLVNALRAANLLVERLESSSADGDTRERVLAEIRSQAHGGMWLPAVCQALASMPSVRREELLASAARLPVYPAVALRVLALGSREDTEFHELADLIGQDQVLAGHLISAANSVLYGPVRRIATIVQAIAYVGLSETCRLITAAALQPLFASAGLSRLWKHSLETARLCEQLASTSRRAHPDEAFLAGLVHDVGRLAISKLPGEANVASAKLVDSGCDPTFAEISLFGAPHADLGAEILRRWNFPAHVVEAVRNHHQPERSASLLAYVLYVAEFRGLCDEATPSGLSLRQALENIGVPPQSLQSLEPEMGALNSLLDAA
jgi:putative nucleotidyltransferase with HDIG domain